MDVLPVPLSPEQGQGCEMPNQKFQHAADPSLPLNCGSAALVSTFGNPFDSRMGLNVVL